MTKKYDYYYNDVVFRVLDGKTEMYVGKGEWKDSPFNPEERTNPESEKYDMGETSKETEQEALRLMKSHDQIEQIRKENGWID